MSGRKFGDSFEQRLRCRRHEKSEEIVEGSFMHRALDARIRQKRFDLGSEQKHPVMEGVIKRLHTHPVPREPNLSFFLVPDREGEHTAKARENALAPLLVPLENYFGVGMVGFELKAQLFEFGADLGVIVNLAVKNDPKRLLFVRHRLDRGRREIDDGKPSMPKADFLPRGNVKAGIVGATMLHRVPHSFDCFNIDGRAGILGPENA